MHQQLNDILQLLKTLLGPDLLGVYLYGSALVGGLQKYSDVDLFVVTNRATTLEKKTKLVGGLLQLSGLYMKGPKRSLEVTIVERTALNPWRYPPNFDFQYGEWLRDSFEKGMIEPWPNYKVPDLALIVTQILLKSETLWGADPQTLLAPVPYPDFIKAMIHDLDRLSTGLLSDTRNVLLTFARIWSTLETNSIRSKPAAADWAIQYLPAVYQPVMKRAHSICIGGENEYWDDLKELIKPCTDFMMEQVNERISQVRFEDQGEVIKLAEESF